MDKNVSMPSSKVGVI